MSKLKLFFTVTAITVVAGIGLAQPAHATTYDDAASANQALYDAAQTFVSDMRSAGTSTSAVTSAVEDFQHAAETAKDEYAQVARDAKDAKAKEYVTKLSTAADAMSASANKMAQAIAAKDQDAYTDAATAFQTAANDYDDASLAYSNYVREHPEQQGDAKYIAFLTFFIVTCVLFVLAVVFAVVMNKKHTNKKLKDRRNQLIIYALLSVIGAGVIFFTYQSAVKNVNGGTYYIPYWAFIGLVLYVIGIIAYLMDYMKLKKAGELSTGPSVAAKIPHIKDAAPAQKPADATDKKPLVK